MRVDGKIRNVWKEGAAVPPARVEGDEGRGLY
jgi:hypothetical protein